MLMGGAVKLIESGLPFADEQLVDGILQHIKFCFFVIAVKGCPDKLSSGILRVLRLVKGLSCVTGDQDQQEEGIKGYFQSVPVL